MGFGIRKEVVEMKNYSYIAADYDHDKNAVDHIKWLKEKGYLSYNDAHDLQQSYDSSLACSIKKSLKFRMDNSYKFVLIVGEQTNTVTKGGCQLCSSYNSHTYACARGYSVDYRSFIKFECDKAVELGIKIVVLYNSTAVNRNLCPEAIRWKGTHARMQYVGPDGSLYWDDNSIIQAFRQ